MANDRILTPDDLLFNKSDNITLNKLNRNFQELLNNDIQIFDSLLKSNCIWECRWFNDDNIDGYMAGDTVWYNITNPFIFLSTNWRKIKDYAQLNSEILNDIYTRFNYSFPDFDTGFVYTLARTLPKDIKTYELVSKECTLYYELLTGYKTLNNKKFPPIFDVGDNFCNINIKVSCKNNNKNLLSDETSWINVWQVDDTLYNKILLNIDNTIEDIITTHTEKYHYLRNASNIDDNNTILYLPSFSDVGNNQTNTSTNTTTNIFDYISPIRLTYDNNIKNVTGVDLVVDEYYKKVNAGVGRTEEDDNVYYKWYRVWKSERIEHGGIIKCTPSGSSAYMTVTIPFNWAKNNNSTTPSFSDNTYTLSVSPILTKFNTQLNEVELKNLILSLNNNSGTSGVTSPLPDIETVSANAFLNEINKYVFIPGILDLYNVFTKLFDLQADINSGNNSALSREVTELSSNIQVLEEKLNSIFDNTTKKQTTRKNKKTNNLQNHASELKQTLLQVKQLIATGLNSLYEDTTAVNFSSSSSSSSSSKDLDVRAVDESEISSTLITVIKLLANITNTLILNSDIYNLYYINSYQEITNNTINSLVNSELYNALFATSTQSYKLTDLNSLNVAIINKTKTSVTIAIPNTGIDYYSYYCSSGLSINLTGKIDNTNQEEAEDIEDEEKINFDDRKITFSYNTTPVSFGTVIFKNDVVETPYEYKVFLPFNKELYLSDSETARRFNINVNPGRNNRTKIFKGWALDKTDNSSSTNPPSVGDVLDTISLNAENPQVKLVAVYL